MSCEFLPVDIWIVYEELFSCGIVCTTYTTDLFFEQCPFLICESEIGHSLFLGVAGPGVMGDREALFQCPLGDMIENLPGLFCAIGDCAYMPTEHLVPIFGGAHAKVTANSNFNFYASQCRIRIEMAFGLMTQKWGILKKPVTCKLNNIWRVVVCIAKLHNFGINMCLAKELSPCPSGTD